jgi:hypothetical protein
VAAVGCVAAEVALAALETTLPKPRSTVAASVGTSGTQMLDRPNPYAAPGSNTSVDVTAPSSRTVWKIYALALVTLQVVGLVMGPPKMDATRALDYCMSVFGIVGLFGYAYRRRVLTRKFWMLWGIFLPLWDLMMGVWVYPSQQSGPQRETVAAYLVLMVFVIPDYVALLRYGYRSPDIWSQAPGPPQSVQGTN